MGCFVGNYRYSGVKDNIRSIRDSNFALCHNYYKGVVREMDEKGSPNYISYKHDYKGRDVFFYNREYKPPEHIIIY